MGAHGNQSARTSKVCVCEVWETEPARKHEWMVSRFHVVADTFCNYDETKIQNGNVEGT